MRVAADDKQVRGSAERVSHLLRFVVVAAAAGRVAVNETNLPEPQHASLPVYRRLPIWILRPRGKRICPRRSRPMQERSRLGVGSPGVSSYKIIIVIPVQPVQLAPVWCCLSNPIEYTCSAAVLILERVSVFIGMNGGCGSLEKIAKQHEIRQLPRSQMLAQPVDDILPVIWAMEAANCCKSSVLCCGHRSP
jgi:hypothetical protein